MTVKYFAIHFCFGLLMLSVFAYPWITNPADPRNQIMASVALINSFLYPFSKLALENFLNKLAGKEFLEKKFFTIDTVGTNKLKTLHWVFSFIFAIPTCLFALIFFRK